MEASSRCSSDEMVLSFEFRPLWEHQRERAARGSATCVYCPEFIPHLAKHQSPSGLECWSLRAPNCFPGICPPAWVLALRSRGEAHPRDPCPGPELHAGWLRLLLQPCPSSSPLACTASAFPPRCWSCMRPTVSSLLTPAVHLPENQVCNLGSEQVETGAGFPVMSVKW